MLSITLCQALHMIKLILATTLSGRYFYSSDLEAITFSKVA